MNRFVEALYSDDRSCLIPAGDDWFGGLIGYWKIEWVDWCTGCERCVEGEWIFARVLEGMAVQDVFIVPSRAARKIDPQSDAEYGTTLRIYNPAEAVWDIFFGCPGSAVRLTARKQGLEIVLTEIAGNMKYVFYELTDRSFRWRKLEADDVGEWTVTAEVFAVRGE